jgi:hypothetical protein
MPEEFNYLVSDALNEIERLFYCRQLLEAAQDELDRKEGKLERVNLFLEFYLSAFECHADDLRAYLKKMQKIVEKARREDILSEDLENCCGDRHNIPS